ncbi:MAG: mandelate racemase/muconate lactonizing enzyme family protein [Actinomycetota bacterium]|jgi:L-alanine-DL-glutamate epimerase-like enolase superfamily enzyme|nr:mandelate racemase/muconate lactonizing enzyme family protein [Actinomycetota bacterium]
MDHSTTTAVADQPLPIERVEIQVFEAPVTLEVSFGALSVRRMCLVMISAGGNVGRGESWVNWPSWAYAERVATIREGVAPLLVGLDANNRDDLLGRLQSRLLPLGRQWGALGPIWQALSAVDVALWDLAGQVAGCSIGRVLSANPRRRVPVYASGVGPNDVTLLMERALEQGFTAAKLKIGFGAEEDRRIISEARSVVGDSFVLFVDANRAWRMEEAKAAMPLLQEHGIAWCEEPLIEDAPEYLDELFEATGMPLALGENVYGLDLATRYMECPGVTQIQPDACKTGGISMIWKCGQRARGRGTSVTPHSYGSAFGVLATVQVASAVDELGILELDVRDNPFRTELLTAPLRIIAGHLEVPQGVSFGQPIDEDILASMEIAV